MITYHSGMQPPVRARGRRRHWTGRILSLLGVALLVMSPAYAKDRKGKHHDPATPAQIEPPGRGTPPREDLREPPREIQGISLDRVIEQVEKRHHARVVRYEKADADGRTLYVLRLLSDEGRVWTVKVDAETGTEQ
jgi:uncharacterized membrane protein YkoI